MLLKMSFDLYPVVEVMFQAVFQGDDTSAFSWIFWNCHFEQPLVDEFMIVCRVFLSSMIQVHLQSQEWKFKLAGDEAESL